MGSDNVSYITILKPRELNYTESSRITTDFLIELETLIDRNKWENRREFFFQTLAFCLSLPNLWRFPREALMQGHAAFVWLYIIFMLSIGSCLLFFEVALGQYSSKGFTKVFAMCPLFEGISYSMALYCMTVSTYYNVLNAYAFIYLFASFNKTLEYAKCSTLPKDICVEGTTNQTLSPENVYFYHRIVYYTVDNFCDFHLYKPNWRNMGVLFFLWVLVCIVIFRGILRAKWPATVYCPLPYIVLSITLIVALTVKGSMMGVKAMFALKFKGLLNTNVWRRAFEQAMVALGLGMGPLITLGSYSQFQSPADIDCMLLCVCILIPSLLSGSIAFAGVGVLAHERNQTMKTVLKQQGNYPPDLSIHVVFTQLFSRLSPLTSHTISFVFFLMFLLGGWYSLITYLETFVVSCYTFIPTSHKHKIYTNLGSCIICFIFGSLLACRLGYSILIALDRYLVQIGLTIIVLCELCAIIYIYGVRDFSDDIDFMLGFYPNIYFQTVWIFSPVILILLLIEFLYLSLTERTTAYEKYMMALTATIIIIPIFVIAMYNLYVSYKMGNIGMVLAPREVIILDDEDFLSGNIVSGQGHTDKESTRWWFNKRPENKAEPHELAGPSRTKTTLFM